MNEDMPAVRKAEKLVTLQTQEPHSSLVALIDGDPRLWSALLDDLSEGVYVTDRDRRILFWNQGAEAISGFDATRMVGSFCRDNLLVHVDEEGTELCGSSCPLEATMRDGRRREAHVFLHHSAGHRVPVHIRALPVRDGTGKV
ncbi:MAG TPA: PAS domain-containing protein, partial [Thermoleophilia bacterium]|nr:PAS domain-containing protein [Thermoleophilia bacterium]